MNTIRNISVALVLTMQICGCGHGDSKSVESKAAGKQALLAPRNPATPVVASDAQAAADAAARDAASAAAEARAELAKQTKH